MKTRIVGILMTLFLTLGSWAQGEDFVIRRGNCMPDVADGAASVRRAPRRLPTRNTEWDASKTYKQLVVLVEYADCSFAEGHNVAFYDKLFNHFDESAYEGKTRYSQGSVADFYRHQSGGLVNLQFDIVGPYKVTENAKDASNKFRALVFSKATEMMLAEQTERDFKQYDWNGNSYIEQVIYVVAGPTGNLTGNEGYLHPNTSAFNSIKTHDNCYISNYSSSAELWTIGSGLSCGIGTICHEFTHSLGLPDIYPANNSWTFSICDEWDLMDGGNFTNYGWCPPNFSPLEKMLLGWLTPIELTEPTTITNLKPVTAGGKVYQVKHTDKEYLLIENRQQEGWDKGLPGKGLVIYHVNYDASAWSANRVNDVSGEPKFTLVHADDMDYDAWDAKMKSEQLSTYQNSLQMNNRHLSTSSYPYEAVNALTDSSTPATTMYNTNTSGQTLLSKPITNIRQNDDGTVSFDFMGGDPSAVEAIRSLPAGQQVQGVYDLAGRRVTEPLAGQLYVVKYTNGATTVKYHKK